MSDDESKEESKDNIEFLEAIHELQQQHNKAKHWLMHVIENKMESDPVLCSGLAEVITIMDLQANLLIRFNEQQFEIMDSMTKLVEKAEKISIPDDEEEGSQKEHGL